MHISTYHASQQKAHSKDQWGYRTIVVHDPCVVLGREVIHFPKISSLEPRPWTPPTIKAKKCCMSNTTKHLNYFYPLSYLCYDRNKLLRTHIKAQTNCSLPFNVTLICNQPCLSLKAFTTDFTKIK